MNDPQIASLTEIERYWTLGMVMDANDALDLKIKLDREAAKRNGTGKNA